MAGKKIVPNNTFTEFLLYTTPNGKVKVEIFLHDENIWLTQDKIALLFGVQRPAITKHLKNIFDSGELIEDQVSSILEHTTQHGALIGKTQTQAVRFYNLDAIISVGYRVNSQRATQFRIWATERLKEYIIKGFTMNDEKLKNVGGGVYWKELLDRIRDIRSSEKVLYRQVLELYATSVDYNSKSDESKKFFAIVQNKLHYAANGKTAAELISERANAKKPFMGLMTFSENGVQKKDVLIAKNYLTEQEIKRLNNIVSAYFDIAELRAMDNIPTKMTDYINQLDKLISSVDRKVLDNAGKISHIEAEAKAILEYKKYNINNLSEVEKEYLESINTLKKKIEKKVSNIK